MSLLPSALLRGYDLSTLDFFNMRINRAMGTGSVISWGEDSHPDEFPEQCLLTADPYDAGCTQSFNAEVYQWETIAAAHDVFAESYDFDMRFSGGGNSATASTGMSNSGLGLSSSSKSGALGEAVAHTGCSYINTACRFGGVPHLRLASEFDTSVRSAGENFLDPTGLDIGKMSEWKRQVVDVYGTDLATGLDHGASVRKTHSYDMTSRTAASSSREEICMGWQGADFEVNGCSATETRTNFTFRDVRSESHCAAVGGPTDAFLKHKICENTATPEELQSFFNDIETRSNDNIINMKFDPLPDVFWTYNNFATDLIPVFQTFRKAIEYHKCIADEHREWDTSGAEGTCRCTRTCSGNGIVDPGTCTCMCFGDSNHGYSGESCQESYGTCQKGEGTGVESTSEQCAHPDENGHPNKCQAGGLFSSHHERCTGGQVCCTTSYRAKCCPFGYSCGRRQYWRRPLLWEPDNPNAQGNELFDTCEGPGWVGNSGDCETCIPPNYSYRGQTLNPTVLSTLFHATVPNWVNDPTHASWQQTLYGKHVDARDTAGQDLEGGHVPDDASARGVQDSGLDFIQERLARLLAEFTGHDG